MQLKELADFNYGVYITINVGRSVGIDDRHILYQSILKIVVFETVKISKIACKTFLLKSMYTNINNRNPNR